MRKRLYFGHPVNVYNTDLEAELLEKIREDFSNWEIVNPAEAQHQEGYQRWAAKTGSGMDYFYQEVLPHCHGAIFLPFRDDYWGQGIFGEAKWFQDCHLPIWKITPTGVVISMPNLDGLRVLSVEETRDRIRNADKTVKQY